MDSTAISLCMDNNLPILVLSLWQDEMLERAMRGEAGGNDHSIRQRRVGAPLRSPGKTDGRGRKVAVSLGQSPSKKPA